MMNSLPPDLDPFHPLGVKARALVLAVVIMVIILCSLL